MRINLQHTTEIPGDWISVDHTEWAQYAAAVKQSVPVGGERISSRLGYLNCLSIMGLYGDGDHYAIEPFGKDGVKLSFWYDDAEDGDILGPSGTIWTFESMRPIAEKGGMWQHY